MFNTTVEKEEVLELLNKFQPIFGPMFPDSELRVHKQNQKNKSSFSINVRHTLIFDPSAKPGTVFWGVFEIKRNFIIFLLEFFRKYPEYIGDIKINNFRFNYHYDRRSGVDILKDTRRPLNIQGFHSFYNLDDVPFRNQTFHKYLDEEQLNSFEAILEQLNKYEKMFRKDTILFKSFTGTSNILFSYKGSSSFALSAKEISIKEDGIFFKKQKIDRLGRIPAIQEMEKKKKELKTLFEANKRKKSNPVSRSFIQFFNEAFPILRPNDKMFFQFITNNENRFQQFFLGEFSIDVDTEQEKVFISFKSGEIEDLTRLFHKKEIVKYFRP